MLSGFKELIGMLDDVDHAIRHDCNRIKNWKTHFCIIPRTCEFTKEILWFKNAYYGYRYIWGVSGESPLRIDMYVEKNAFLIWSLQGENWNE